MKPLIIIVLLYYQLEDQAAGISDVLKTGMKGMSRSGKYNWYTAYRSNISLYECECWTLKKSKVSKIAIYTYDIRLSYLFSDIPSIQHKCLLWDSSCLKAQAQISSAALVSGIPKLGTARLDPMHIDYIHIDQDGFKIDLRNMNLQGLQNMVIDDISIDLPSKLARLVFHTDFLAKSTYITSGSLLSLPIYGEGEYTMRLYNVLIEMVIPFEIIKDAHGRDIMDMKTFQYIFDVRNGAQFYFDNLYNGDKHLSEIMHQTLHQNWKLLTIQFARYLFDIVNDKAFNTIRSYMRSQPLTTLASY